MAVFIAFLSLSSEPVEGAWKTVRLNEMSYVAVADFAEVFGMERGKSRRDKREIAYAGQFHRLMVKTGTREAIVDGVRHWLSFPVLSSGGKDYVSLADINATLGPAMSPASVKPLPKVKTIIFDPGHGGHDRGARSPYGDEKDYALDVVNRTRRILETKGVKVVQSRLSDFFVGLSERPSMTSNYPDPVFVSVHFNAASWRPSANGIEVYSLPPLGYPVTGKALEPALDRRQSNGDSLVPASFVFANTMQHTLLGKTGGFDRGVKRARYAVLRHAKVPAILIEGAFLTHSGEAKKVHSEQWREELSKAIAEGILAYMTLANETQLPKRAWDYGREPTDEFVWEE
ncbi:MAG: N-acetylmuramoyl-L-alanine amidase [Verrucomicrobiota bacterium]